MSNTIPWIAIAVIGLMLLLLAVYITRKEKSEPDYRTFFIMGVIWLAIGLVVPLISGRPFEMSGLISLGLIFTLMGLANKSKWKKKPEQLTKNQKLILLGLVLLLVLVVV
ncbi:MAG: hypothetical protein MUO43_02155, partial [Desulfobacterales bacterium]|nr:hypothetical protein [Desulfobacterales bacterium]